MVHETLAESNRLSGEIAAATERWLKLGNKIEVVPITRWEGEQMKFNRTVNPEHEAMSAGTKTKPVTKTYSNKSAIKNHLKGRFFYELRKTMSTEDVVKKLVALSDCAVFVDRYSSNQSVVTKRLTIYREYMRSQGMEPVCYKSYKSGLRKTARIEKENLIAKLYDSGLTAQQIGKEMGYNPVWIRKLYNSYKKRIANADNHKAECKKSEL